VLDRLGDDGDSRYGFFRRFVELARTVVTEANSKH
jgi:hypothetical protein